VKLLRLLCVVILLIGNRGWSQTPLTNQQWVAEVWDTLLDSLVRKMPADADSLSLLVQDGAQGKKMVLEGAFVRHFASAGKHLSLQRRGNTFVIQQVDFTAGYRPLTASWLGFNQRYQRHLTLRLRGWLENNPGKQVVFFFNVSHAHTDTLNRKDIEQIEMNSYPAFRGKWRSYSFWTRFLEPGVVIVSSLAVIYLFFSMRT